MTGCCNRSDRARPSRPERTADAKSAADAPTTTAPRFFAESATQNGRRCAAGNATNWSNAPPIERGARRSHAITSGGAISASNSARHSRRPAINTDASGGSWVPIGELQDRPRHAGRPLVAPLLAKRRGQVRQDKQAGYGEVAYGMRYSQWPRTIVRRQEGHGEYPVEDRRRPAHRGVVSRPSSNIQTIQQLGAGVWRPTVRREYVRGGRKNLR